MNMLKQWRIVLLSILGILALCGLGRSTNPDQTAYETFAVDQIGNLASDQCDRAPEGLGILLQGACRAAISAYKPQLSPLLATATTRQDYGLFSIYQSNISIPTANFSAKVESIGIFNHFFIYKFPSQGENRG